MVAVPEMPLSEPVVQAATGGSAVPASRAVAVTVSPMELFRPESHLAELIAGFPQSDLLVAVDDTRPDAEDDDVDEYGEELRASVARLGLPGLALHRLGLLDPLPAAAEDDLVAAMSELVGFDPEPGLYCLAPVPAPADPARVVVERAVQRIARVYGIPLLRYRCLELAIVT
ncbi:MAG TPA: hypothetical protein VKZ81_15885 [Pseudonocardia sp.]|jgi:hypothetical protein|uniref:hypothetical protein n=1 Tax=Pseudonocardia sp. TaxID=60912 RepID=UPI002B4B2D69|nr:hypothetical protein [Pseudonocardia sp.]HLU56940.1 hypothetical protein [Pseudonocardia sp.]